MLRMIWCTLAATAIVCSLAVGAEEQVDALQYAKGAANWILSISRDRNGALTWPVNDADKNNPAFDLYSGMPGGILLLAEMAKEDPSGPYARALPASVAGLESMRVSASMPSKTRIDRLLKADAHMTWGILEGGGLRIPLGLYNGLSGIAWLYLELHRLTGEVRYLDGARSALERILDRGLFESGSALWDNSTDIISGAAGTGLLCLRAASIIKSPRCLPMAEAAGDFLLKESIQTPAGFKWKTNLGAERVYPNFAHGTAGVAYFLSLLYQTTGRTQYLAAALGGARELQLNADENSRQKTCAWFHHEGDGEDLWYAGWCHGPAGTARLFYQLSRKYPGSLPKTPDLISGGNIPRSIVNRTRDDRPMAWVECAANWLLNSGIPEPRKSINGYWNEGICCGTAGIGEFFVDLYFATRKPDYLRAAEKMALHLAKTAERVGSGYRWVQAENRVSPQNRDAQTGYAQGGAGIGLFFLKLSRAQRGNPIGWRLPDNPFWGLTIDD